MTGDDESVKTIAVQNSIHRLLPGAPTKTRTLVGVDVKTSNEIGRLTEFESNEMEDNLAFQRRLVLAQFVAKKISRTEAIEKLKIKRARFYDLLKDFRQSNDYTGMVRGKRGPKIGSTNMSDRLLAIFEEAFEDTYHGPKASVRAVLRRAEALCFKSGEKRPTRFKVEKYIKSKPERFLYFRKFGEEAAAQKYDHRPGYKEAPPSDADVQMDHTQVDLLLVDERDRSCIIGRPWLTIIICTLTRIIMGYFLSLRVPNVSSVQLALISAILPKDSPYNPLKADPDEYPFFGVMPGCYTDNAAEFKTQQLLQKCARYGIDWGHRPIGKKWYGAIVERVIGTFMTRAVHFLPGSTGSNVVEREYFQSELNATMDFPQFCAWFGSQVSIYHSKKHSALGCSPRIAWAQLRSPGALGELTTIGNEEALSFALDFMPSKYGLKINNYGINFESRRFWGEELIGRIGQECDIRYDPNDLRTIWVLLDTTFYNVGCSRMCEGDSINYESHKKSVSISRSDTTRRQIPDGSHTDEYGIEAEFQSEAIVADAIASTSAYKTQIPAVIEEVPSVDLDVKENQSVALLPSSLDNDDSVDDLKPYILVDAEKF